MGYVAACLFTKVEIPSMFVLQQRSSACHILAGFNICIYLHLFTIQPLKANLNFLVYRLELKLQLSSTTLNSKGIAIHTNALAELQSQAQPLTQKAWQSVNMLLLHPQISVLLFMVIQHNSSQLLRINQDFSPTGFTR